MIWESPHTGRRYLNGVRYSELAHERLSNPSQLAGKPLELIKIDDEWHLIEVRPVITYEEVEDE